MATPKKTTWKMEPHTQAKHEILRRYLGAWFPILGKHNERILYIDGFCGPGRYDDGEVGSPILALQEAKKHQDRLSQNQLTFFFVDERPDRIAQLNSELKRVDIPDNFKLEIIAGTFERQFRNLLDNFDDSEMQTSPTFAFIDPFGFKGIPFELVRRLLEKPRTEVFINIMADSINRFLEHPDDATRQHIIDLFGTSDALKIADSRNRIEALRLLYQSQLKQHARFVRYFEMRNMKNRPIYYLFFATNNPLGHLKMKDAFWKVDSSSGLRFSDATNPHQLVLFELDESETLAKELQHRFANQKLPVRQVREYVENETSFLSSHMKKVLLLLEQEINSVWKF
ncbi:MAG TPA: three-Cys-motif partner protein TcmP [Chromatiaceae bacterium]|nr:three-Cys-motif partner protein TcmP [Chromatiaceae bacterium]